MKPARQTIFEGMELLPGALTEFVEDRLSRNLPGHWQQKLSERVAWLKWRGDGRVLWDQAALLKAMMEFWKVAFAPVLGHAERAHVSELLDVRNRLAHGEPFSLDDAERALDTMRRLAAAVGAQDIAARLAEMRQAALQTIGTETTIRDPAVSPRPLENLAARPAFSAASAGMTQAEQIRMFVITNYANPARAAKKAGFTVRAGDVHRSMGLSNAMPNVCSAIGGQRFQQAAEARLERRDGPKAGSTATFRFVFQERVHASAGGRR